MPNATRVLAGVQATHSHAAGAELVPLVLAGATFIDGKLQERSPTGTDMATKNTDNTGCLGCTLQAASPPPHD